MQEIMEMSKKELDRNCIMQKLLDKQITQKKAAELLNLKSDRHVRNLLSMGEHGGQTCNSAWGSDLQFQHGGQTCNSAIYKKFYIT
jgi:hypothetical protein